MSLAISANGLYALSKSSTVNSMVAASALALPHQHWYWYWHQHWHLQWHCLTNFVIKTCLSSLATIKLIVLCTTQL
jgi:hypothetical protein